MFNESRLQEVICDIIVSIENRVTECQQAKDFNRAQLKMFKTMLQDVILSTDMNYSERTEDILDAWKQCGNGERGYYFMNYIYGFDKTKQYSLS